MGRAPAGARGPRRATNPRRRPSPTPRPPRRRTRGRSVAARRLLADAHTGAARNLLAINRREEAYEHADAARSILARWPGWRLDEAQAILHRLGDGRGHASGVADLTARELEVVRLVAQGHTNGQIAGRLFISTKTASVHVSNVLRKSGPAVTGPDGRMGRRPRPFIGAWVAWASRRPTSLCGYTPRGATSSTSKPSPSSR